MKHFILMMCLSAACLVASAQGKKTIKPKAPGTEKKTTASATASVKSSLDSFSYALGMNIANNLKAQGIESVNGATMQRAMDDVFNKKTIALTDQQANSVIQASLQGNAAKKVNVEKAKCAQYLDGNKKRSGVVSLPSGLQYEVLKKGNENSPTPKLQDTVVAHYAGTLIDGKEFDNSYKRGEPLTIPVGGVIKGWTEALQLMHIGDKWRVYIPSELGYGDRGAGADIPGGAALVFEMELLEIKPAATDTPKQEKGN